MAQAASEEKRQHSPVSLSFYPYAVRGIQQSPPLNLSQPVPEPYAKTLRTLYSPDANGQIGAQQTIIGRFICEPPHSRQAQIDGCGGS